MALYIMIRKIAENPTSAKYALGIGEDCLGQLKIDKATGDVILAPSTRYTASGCVTPLRTGVSCA